MKTSILTFFCAAFVSLSVLGQTPTSTVPPPPPAAPVIATPAVTPAAPAVPVVTATPFAPATPAVTPTPRNSVTVTVSSSSTPSPDDEIDNVIERKIRSHFGSSSSNHSGSDEDAAWIALPIVFISLFAIFGTPVLIVAVILYFSSSRTRAMHKTVRLMVEKGQPVPEALLNPPPIVRQRSDLRRSIKWMLWGVGIMIFLGACNDWDGGAWSLGIIPFLIGVAYLIFWRLDLRESAPAQSQPVTQPPPPPPSSPTV